MIKNIFFACFLPLFLPLIAAGPSVPQVFKMSDVLPMNPDKAAVTLRRYIVKQVDKSKQVELNGRQLRIGSKIDEDDIASIVMEKGAYFTVLNRDRAETEYYTAGDDCDKNLCSPKLVGIIAQAGHRIIKIGTKEDFEKLVAKIEAALSDSEKN